MGRGYLQPRHRLAEHVCVAHGGDHTVQGGLSVAVHLCNQKRFITYQHGAKNIAAFDLSTKGAGCGLEECLCAKPVLWKGRVHYGLLHRDKVTLVIIGYLTTGIILKPLLS